MQLQYKLDGLILVLAFLAVQQLCYSCSQFKNAASGNEKGGYCSNSDIRLNDIINFAKAHIGETDFKCAKIESNNSS